MLDESGDLRKLRSEVGYLEKQLEIMSGRIDSTRKLNEEAILMLKQE